MHTEMDRSEYFIPALFPSLGRRAALLASKIEKSAIISSSGDWILASLIVAIVRRKRIFMVHRGIRWRDAFAVNPFASVGHGSLPNPEKRSGGI